MTMLDEWRLDGKVALVTGGGTGLGKAAALALAGVGADVVVAGRRRDVIEETASEIGRLGRKCRAVPADVTKVDDVSRLVNTALAEFGRIDVLVNNVGGVVKTEGFKQMWEITDEEWHAGIDTNLTSVFLCCRAIGKHMVDRKTGSVVNFASMTGMRGIPNHFMYCSSKGGVIALTQTLAISWASYGVRANAIAPAQFATWRTKEEYEAKSRFMPTGRVGRAEEIGPLTVYLASNASRYVTGQVFCVDGGVAASGVAPVDFVPAVRSQAGGAAREARQ